MKKVCKYIVLLISIYFVFITKSFAKITNDEYDYLNTTEISELSNVKAEHILLYNLNDNKILYKKSIDDKISMASLTKIMTAIVAIENIDNLDDKVTLNSLAFSNISGYAKAGFKIGDVVTYRDLLYGIMLPSGVEAAQGLAISISGDIDSFVNLMNEKAKQLGMNNTHYSNPVGRDDVNNYSTLSDLSKLLFYALDNEEFYEIYTTRKYITTNNLELSSTLEFPAKRYGINVDDIIGSKSGYTHEAGLCLSSIAEFNGVKYLLIITNSLYDNGYPNHVIDSLNIYNYYKENYGYHNILNKDQELLNINVEDGFIGKYKVISDNNVSLYLKNDMIDKIEYKYNVLDTLNYKVSVNEKLGSMNITYKDKILYTYDIYLRDNIKYKHTKLVILSILLILIIIITIILIKRRKKKNVINLNKEDMSLEEITVKEFKKYYYKDYNRLFPGIEKNTYHELKRKEKIGITRFFSIKVSNNNIGFMIINSLNENFIVLDYFAILLRYQSNGYGTKSIELLSEKFSDCTICIEVEKNGFGKNNQENNTRKRRINFYENCGFKSVDFYIYYYHVYYSIYCLNLNIDSNSVLENMRNIYVSMWGEEEISKNLEILYDDEVKDEGKDK